MPLSAQTNNNLVEQLKAQFPIQSDPLLGQCILIPNSKFQPQWSDILKHANCKVFFDNHNGEATAFIQLPKNRPKENSNYNETDVKQLKRRWTSEDDSLLKDLHSQNLPLKDIASKLDRTKVAVTHRIQHLGLSTDSQAINKEVANEPAEPTLNDNTVKEFLSAASMLYPSHKTACAFLLREASNQILKEKP